MKTERKRRRKREIEIQRERRLGGRERTRER